ncbi:4'-phosphopantetheinyl transferase family protein [Actinocrispum wychmicini]|uniref:4'-phosphopantetheinyl transferase n=1 Tax=Actinocrispum wychmicini TaxID=1213861 RepID=A0A4R2JKY4_9PSEU|nr:4'-phosphopantetheinyl transferase superfamily protein [Actinocrispum wychmicini]TCO60703.1 4'-phosphopantetheinyl transferase [Actinocrispum wychmicini]
MRSVRVAVAPKAPQVGESAAARKLLCRLIASPATVVNGPNGRPFLPGRLDLSISLSHSGEWVAAAVGVGVDVGVDVQVPERATDGLIRRCCTSETGVALAGMADRDVEFAWIWTAQEACVKATGQGLAGLPWRIPVDVGQRAGTWQGVRWVSLRGRSPVPASCAYREMS